MRRSLLAAVAIACLAGLIAAAPAGAAFGLKDLDVRFLDEHGAELTEAGAHPFAMKLSLSTETKPEPALPEIGVVPDGEIKDLAITQIAGLAGNPTATPRCTTVDFLNIHSNEPACSLSTKVGRIKVTVTDPHTTLNPPLYNLEPPPGAVLKLGFIPISGVTVTVEVGIKQSPPYNPIAKLTNITNAVQFYASETTLWGVPADHAHDADRGGESKASPVPFLTLPRACEGPLESVFQATSWQGASFSKGIPTHDDFVPPQPQGFTDCARLGFGPEARAKPSTDQAESPSGLDFEFDVDDENLANPKGNADSDIKKIAITLPKGMTINPSVAEGLKTCTPVQYDAESLSSEPGEGCPEASKVGTVESETPLLEDQVLKGQLFVAQQDDPTTAKHGAENPFDSLIALYLVIKDPEMGVLVKLAGKVEPDHSTGQLIATFGEPNQELPQFPVSHVRTHLREGGRSPLITPPACGTYVTEAAFTPWADPAHPLQSPSSFTINRGVGGGPCPPAGPPPFAPGFTAGTLNNAAGSFSPFYLRLTRRDGDQDMTKVSTVLPPGVVGKLAGVGKCQDAQIAAAKAKRGREEIASPSCPASSEIGRTLAGAGVGSQLTYVPGKLYLAGPYRGDPLSIVSITPAVAGPFDVGNVVLRFALTLDPKTAEVQVDGANSDPIPHILEGIVLKVRDLRVYTDRPNFTLNPTSCAPSKAKATLFGSFANVFDPADDVPVNLSDRFQAANCASLGFKPKLSMRLKGGTRRGAHPSLRAVVTPRKEDANFKAAVVTLPRSAFLDQGHIRTICTRVQFAAKSCPKGAIYGHASVQTPLLDEPLSGPVYLRSSNHNLPDLVVDLHGIVEIEASARIDSHKGGIRTSFEAIPDAPFSKFVLELPGGKKGLIVNSRNLCAGPSHVNAQLTGQNGKRYEIHPQLKAAGC